MLDFVLCHPPMSLPDTPLMGLALLTGILSKHNFTCKMIDLNVKLFKSGIFNTDQWDIIVTKYTSRTYFDNEYEKIRPFIESQADIILDLNPRFIGIGVFTKNNEYVTEKLCQYIRLKSSKIKILVGGMYCEFVGPKFLEKGLIDFYINGPAENAIINLANNITIAPGINNLEKDITDPNDNPLPDYSQLDLSLYRSTGLYIIGSRGCPYKCTFCSISERWPKYQLRQIDHIIEELEYHILNNHITRFYFSDSLVNGNMKYFRQLCIALRELNDRFNSEITIQWFMTIRNKYQMTESDFDLMHGVGVNTIKLGIESGSSSVLTHMKKGYKIPDLYYFLDQLQRVNIKCDLFFITGYPTESSKDFQSSIDLLSNLVQYKNIINFIRVATLNIEPKTTLNKMGYEIGTTPEGIERYKFFRNKIFDLGFNIRHDKVISSYFDITSSAV